MFIDRQMCNVYPQSRVGTRASLRSQSLVYTNIKGVWNPDISEIHVVFCFVPVRALGQVKDMMILLQFEE